MTYFHKNGHLTTFALQALIANEIENEETRLEIAEHLSFCDACLEKYTALLTDDTLQTPENVVTQGIFKRIKHRAQAIFFHRITRVAVAVVLTFGLWISGAFHVFVPAQAPSETPTPPTNIQGQKTDFWADRFDVFLQNISHQMQNITKPNANSNSTSPDANSINTNTSLQGE